MRLTPQRLLVLAAFGALLCLGGCPKPAANSSDPKADDYKPSAPIPGDNKLTKYGKLWLGMNSLQVAQEYNAPEGQGQGFSRVIEDYGSVQNHVVDFTPAKPEKTRRLVLRMFRDQLVKLVERREGLSAKEWQDWFAQLKKDYGAPEEIIPGVQWSWGENGGVLLSFTQDNGPEGDIKANVVLEHQPSYNASVDYASAYQQAHPPKDGADSDKASE